MGGRASKQKGSRRELQFAKLIGGKKTPLSGALGGEYSNDVKGMGLEWEVKARATGFKQIYDWVLDEREKPDALALKVDHKPWLVVMTLDKFKELMDK